MSNWVAVVDQDAASLKTISQILSRENIDVSELKSGGSLKEFLKDNRPSLILLNVTLPDMSGFEALKMIREEEAGQEEIPVMFLTAEDDLGKETEALRLGASDVIHKPCHAGTLLSRVQNALRVQEKMRQYEQDMMTDSMTGFLNKSAAESRMEELCSRETGILCVLDLDAFKMVNDFYGHDQGDEVLILFSRILQRQMRSNDVCGRIGGDEFVLFMRNMHSEEELRRFVQRINEEYLSEVQKLAGTQLSIPFGVSVGAVAVPEMGRDYPTLFRFADRALYTVKQNGKHGCSLYESRSGSGNSLAREMNLETTTAILEERNASPSAMWMGEDAFIGIYRYMVRYMERYHGIAFRVLFTVRIIDETCPPSERAEIVLQFRSRVQHSLRNSDVMMEVGENKLFLLLPAARDYDVEKVIGRLLENWHKSPLSEKSVITYETGLVQLHKHPEYHQHHRPLYECAVLTASDENAKQISQVLEPNHAHVSIFSSVEEMMEALRDYRFDLVLVDASLPDLNAASLMDQIQENCSPQEIPSVIFLLSEHNPKKEAALLSAGVEDYLLAPFTPEILLHRVLNVLDLANCRRNHLVDD